MFGYLSPTLEGQSCSVLYPTPDEFERTGARIAPLLKQHGHYSDERIMKRVNQRLRETLIKSIFCGEPAKLCDGGLRKTWACTHFLHHKSYGLY